MDRRHRQNSTGSIEQLIEPKGPIIFFKEDWLYEKLLTKLQNLNLYINNGIISYSMANVSLTHDCHVNLSNQSPLVKKWEQFLHKKRSKNLRFRTTIFFIYQILSIEPEEKSLGVLPSL